MAGKRLETYRTQGRAVLVSGNFEEMGRLAAGAALVSVVNVPTGPRKGTGFEKEAAGGLNCPSLLVSLGF